MLKLFRARSLAALRLFRASARDKAGYEPKLMAVRILGVWSEIVKYP